MYSGTTLRALKYFDAWFGAHQKIDRTARRHLRLALGTGPMFFPSSSDIQKFEGLNGPDGIKRKRPSPDEPWHFYDPDDPHDNKLVKIIDGHYDQLVQSLHEHDGTRAAFEAAWLAHAIVDGLTPAHHYPFEAELTKLRSGQGIDTRDSIKEKLLMHGDTLSEQVKNNWKMWGDKGLIATHFAFEWGIAIMITPLRLRLAKLNDADQSLASAKSAGELFKFRAAQVAALDMYKQFYQSGWTPKLAKVARRQLMPLIVNAVTIIWYKAVIEAQDLENAS